MKLNQCYVKKIFILFFIIINFSSIQSTFFNSLYSTFIGSGIPLYKSSLMHSSNLNKKIAQKNKIIKKEGQYFIPTSPFDKKYPFMKITIEPNYMLHNAATLTPSFYYKNSYNFIPVDILRAACLGAICYSLYKTF